MPGYWFLSVIRARLVPPWDLKSAVKSADRSTPPALDPAAPRTATICDRKSSLKHAGIVILKSVSESIVTCALDSAVFKLAEYAGLVRAFRQWRLRRHSCRTYFTGARDVSRLAGSLRYASFSSSGGRWTIQVFPTPLRFASDAWRIQMAK